MAHSNDRTISGVEELALLAAYTPMPAGEGSRSARPTFWMDYQAVIAAVVESLQRLP